MTPEDYQQACDAFDHASQLSPAERSGWLAAHFADRADLRQQVAAMLSQADDSRLDHSPLDAVLTPDSPTIGWDTVTAVPLSADKIQVTGYEIEAEIARGGMGVVYRARQQNPSRTVALKMILAGQFASTDEVARFRIEAEAAANLTHPGIVPIYEVGSHDGRHYFSMGYVAGQSLAAALKTRSFAPDEAADLVRQIAEAIQHAHQHGVIHRDLKPSNVLLDEQGRPQVTDFGLAKRIGDDTDLTCTGQIMGSPGYMAPEQASGRVHQVGAATDVYGLGAILYALLTGKPPFESDNLLDAIDLVCSSDVTPPRKHNRQIPRKLETICLKCLHKTPSARYHTAGELAADLHAYLNNEPIQARPLSLLERIVFWARRRPGLAITWAAMLLFYAYHLFCVWVVRDPVSSAPLFQVISIATALGYAIGAWFFQRMYEKPRRRSAAIYLWMSMNVVLLTMLLFSANGAASPLVLGYVLLVAASGALYQTGLVGYVTAISLIGYYIHVFFSLVFPKGPPFDIHWTICLSLTIVLLGMIQYFVVRKIRMANA